MDLNELRDIRKVALKLENIDREIAENLDEKEPLVAKVSIVEEVKEEILDSPIKALVIYVISLLIVKKATNSFLSFAINGFKTQNQVYVNRGVYYNAQLPIIIIMVITLPIAFFIYHVYSKISRQRKNAESNSVASHNRRIDSINEEIAIKNRDIDMKVRNLENKEKSLNSYLEENYPDFPRHFVDSGLLDYVINQKENGSEKDFRKLVLEYDSLKYEGNPEF